MSVYISDPEGDSFDWSITTSPNVGSSSGTGEFDGTKNCDISGLNYETTYIWTVTATDTDGSGETTEEDYTFTTESAPNNPPNPPSNPDPSDGETNVDVNAILSWTCSDPDGDSLTYNVYFEMDDSTPDELVSENQTDTTYDPGTMSYNTNYYWQIVAFDDNGAYTSGPVWSFTTETKTSAHSVKGVLYLNDSIIAPSDIEIRLVFDDGTESIRAVFFHETIAGLGVTDLDNQEKMTEQRQMVLGKEMFFFGNVRELSNYSFCHKNVPINYHFKRNVLMTIGIGKPSKSD